MSYQPGPAPQPPRPAPPPRPTGYRAALRVAGAIAAVKWLLMVLLVLGYGAGALVLFTGDLSDFSDLALVLVLVGGVVVLLLAELLVWVVLGWFEHTLRVLVAVADHTREG